jgi:hypothetical protein
MPRSGLQPRAQDQRLRGEALGEALGTAPGAAEALGDLEALKRKRPQDRARRSPARHLPAAPQVYPGHDGRFYLRLLAQALPEKPSDLADFDVAACTGDSVMNRGIQVAVGIAHGIGLKQINVSIFGGNSSTDCIKSALESGRKYVVIAKRSVKAPSGTAELVLT